MPLFLTYIAVSAVAVPAAGVQGRSRPFDYCGGFVATWSSAEGETLPATNFLFFAMLSSSLTLIQDGTSCL